ncbi:hypothetical protein BU17DRAFT_59853 [Hysterangium stoloniferum]|nr:hypothetical protein BU17DRAFT_59853 [Hysterangium stoloniferum]
MQDPQRDLIEVIRLVEISNSPSALRDVFNKYFVNDLLLDHPIVKVLPAANSKEIVLGIFTWYRMMSPVVELKVDDLCMTPQILGMRLLDDSVHSIQPHTHESICQPDTRYEKAPLFDGTCIFCKLPFRPDGAIVRMLLELSLVRRDDLYYIKRQEDFYLSQARDGSIVCTAFKLSGALDKALVTSSNQAGRVGFPSSRNMETKGLMM